MLTKPTKPKKSVRGVKRAPVDELQVNKLAPTLAVLLIKGSTWFHHALQANLKANGMSTTTRAQGHVIASIAAGEHRASRIAHNLGISAQGASQLLAEMETQGILLIKQDPADKRARIVEFDPSWEGYHLIARQILLGLEAHVEGKFGKPLIDVVRLVLESDWQDPPIIRLNEMKGEGDGKNPKRRLTS